jgi:hypothetical protein
MVKCPFCQFENEDGALFCEQCKSDLGVTEPVAAQPANRPVVDSESDTLALEPLTHPVAAVAVAEATIPDTPLPVAQVAEAPATLNAAGMALPFAEATPVPVAPETTPIPADSRDATQTFAPAKEPTTAGPLGTATEAVPLPAGTKPKLVVFRGQRLNVEYPIYEGDNYIGRADEKPVDIDLDDQEAPDRVWSSRQHAIITFEDSKLSIEDLNSTNGTFVNRSRVHPGQKRPLQLNDVIQIGTVQMRVKA